MGASPALPQVSPEAKLPLQHSSGVTVALCCHMQREDACTGGQEAAPKQAQAQKAGALLNRQQQAPDWRCKRRGYTCAWKPSLLAGGWIFWRLCHAVSTAQSGGPVRTSLFYDVEGVST